MNNNKKIPHWCKGGLIGIGFYVTCVLVSLGLFTFGDAFLREHPQFLAPGAGSFLIPLIVISFYPGLIFAGDYERYQLIIPINIVFYFILGAVIARVMAKNKPTL